MAALMEAIAAPDVARARRLERFLKLGTIDEKMLPVISSTLYWTAHIGGALLVLALGKWAASRKGKSAPAH